MRLGLDEAAQPLMSSNDGTSSTSASAPTTAPPRARGEQAGLDVEAEAGDDREEELEEEGEEEGYSLEHLSAVVRPVFLTMALATIAVANVRDPSQDANLSAGLNSYLVYGSGSAAAGGGGGGAGGGGGGGGGGGSALALGQAAVNALVIVCVICVATFGLVLCYKYRCMRLMLGYLMFSSASLLGYSGGLLVSTALQVGGVPWDLPSLIFVMWNFALVGVVAVFWQKGVPRLVTQGYLVCVSVIMAWICACCVWGGGGGRENLRACCARGALLPARCLLHSPSTCPRWQAQCPSCPSGPCGRCSWRSRCMTCAPCSRPAARCGRS